MGTLIYSRNTNQLERFLLFGAIASIPLQESVPTVGGMSLSFIMLGLATMYIVLCRGREFSRICQHPIFLALGGFVGVGLFMELVNESDGFKEIFKISFMVLGGIVIASMCRDKEALKVALYGFLFGSFVTAIVLILSMYGKLSALSAGSFIEASHMRQQYSGENPLEGNLNQIAFLIAQGAVAGLALAFAEKQVYRRMFLFTLCAFCIVGTFLPMSRSGILTLFVSGGAVMFIRGILNIRVLVASLVFGVLIVALVPDVVWTRFTISTENLEGKDLTQDARVNMYSRVVENLPDVIWTGVGISNYYGAWGEQHGFSIGHKSILGTHNCFAQVTMYWGLPGLLAFSLVLWKGYRYVPKPINQDGLLVGLVGVCLAMLLRSIFMHQLYDKGFSVAFGLLVGASTWIWSNRRTGKSGMMTSVRKRGNQISRRAPIVSVNPRIGKVV